MTLYPYQAEGVEWLAPKHFALLGDQMGLGKTPQALVAAKKAGVKRLLVVCPAVTIPQWERQIAAWTPGTFDVTVLSYNRVVQNLEVLKLGRFDLMILDEAHLVKSIDAQRAAAILGKQGIIRNCDRVWALTGTPMQNHPGELWTLTRVFGYTKYRYEEWLARFCKIRVTPYGPKPVGAKEDAMPELREILKRFTLRRRVAEVQKDLPKVNISTIVVEPGPVDMIEHFPAYQNAGKTLANVRADMEKALSKLERDWYTTGPTSDEAFDALAAQTESYSTLRRFVGLQKCKPLADLIYSEMGSKYKLVVFFEHKAMVEEMRILLDSRVGMKAIYGGTKPEKRDEYIRQFIEKPTRNHVLMVQTKVGGTGLDGLQAVCNQAILLEPSWVPGENAQCIGRLARIGQKLPVFVRFIALNNMLDKAITEANIRKTRDIELAGLGEQPGGNGE